MIKKSKVFTLSILLMIALILSACNYDNPAVQKITIEAMEKSVYAEETVKFNIVEELSEIIEVRWALVDTTWALGDTTFYTGHSISHTFKYPGVYHVNLYRKAETGYKKESSVIIRVQDPEVKIVPQVLLDTDARNEIDDQHFITYALYSGVDVLGITSIHNDEAYSEPKNYGEICHVMQLIWYSGYEKETPLMFHGATHKLERPESGVWSDTRPIITEASNAILAAVRGASPEHPVYILPVGPCTNMASALLQARQEGFDLMSRIRVIALIGGPESAGSGTYNGRNDPWSVYVVGASGVDFTVILEHPTSYRLKFIRDEDSDRYPENAKIGYYLHEIIMNRLAEYDDKEKALYDLTTVSAVINDYMGLDWIEEVEDMKIANLDKNYAWEKIDGKSNIHVVWDIDEKAMKDDFFNTLNGNPTKLTETEQ